jgi:predicted TIM-barrel fold metal-dependent hydrolase
MINGRVIIDIHAHVEYIGSSERMSARDFVYAMDEVGVDKAVILGGDQADAGSRPPWSDPEEIVTGTSFDDDEVARFCSEYPQRLIGFGSVHPERHRPERKVERAVEHLGLKGIKLYPHSGFYPNDSRLDLMYQACADMQIPVMIHTGAKAVRWQVLKFNRPVYVDEVATRFPKLQIIMCHGGFPWYDEFLVVAHSNPNIHVDISWLNCMEKTFHRPGFTERVVRELTEIIGAHRVLWGSEGPISSLPLYGSHSIENYKKSVHLLVERFDFLSDVAKVAILGGNAHRLLALDQM